MRRVVVTGMGIITSVGADPLGVFDRCVQGHCGIQRVRRFDTNGFHCKIGAEIAAVPPLSTKIDDRLLRALNPYHLSTIYVIERALLDAGIRPGAQALERTGLLVGTTNAMGRDIHMEDNHLFSERTFFSRSPINASVFSHVFGLSSMSFTINTASASSASAVGLGYQLIRSGQQERVITGGGDFGVLPSLFADFNGRWLSRENACPERAYRPFDLKGNTRVLGDACGALVLEDYDSARQRGCKVYCEVKGYGSHVEPVDFLNPHVAPYTRAIRLSLEEARLEAQDVSCVLAHCAGSKHGDLVEAIGIYRSLYENGTNIVPVVATTPVHGYVLGGSGVVGSILAILAMQEGIVPGTRNVSATRSKHISRLDIVVKNRAQPVPAVLVCNYGFGGYYTALLFSRRNGTFTQPGRNPDDRSAGPGRPRPVL